MVINTTATNCGLRILSGFHGNEAQIEKSLKANLETIKLQNNGYFTVAMIMCTLLKKGQAPAVKVLTKYGFKHTPWTESKYQTETVKEWEAIFYYYPENQQYKRQQGKKIVKQA